MFRSLSAKIFTMLVALIALLGITNITLRCKKATSKIGQLFVSFFLMIFSSFIFHTNKSRVLADAVREIFAIDKCICSKQQRELLLM